MRFYGKKLPAVYCILFSCYLSVCEGYDFVCPSPGHWSLRAKAVCPTTTQYTCLYDVSNRQNMETCAGPRKELPGKKTTINNNNFNTVQCSKDRFQPFDFSTEKTTSCIYLKSKCSGEGQYTIINTTSHSTTVDTTCGCKQGFSFISSTNIESCSCIPFIEDCTCINRPTTGDHFHVQCPSQVPLDEKYEDHGSEPKERLKRDTRIVIEFSNRKAGIAVLLLLLIMIAIFAFLMIIPDETIRRFVTWLGVNDGPEYTENAILYPEEGCSNIPVTICQEEKSVTMYQGEECSNISITICQEEKSFTMYQGEECSNISVDKVIQPNNIEVTFDSINESTVDNFSEEGHNETTEVYKSCEDLFNGQEEPNIKLNSMKCTTNGDDQESGSEEYLDTMELIDLSGPSNEANPSGQSENEGIPKDSQVVAGNCLNISQINVVDISSDGELRVDNSSDGELKDKSSDGELQMDSSIEGKIKVDNSSDCELDVNKSSVHEVDNLSNGKLQMDDGETKVDSSSDVELKVDNSSDYELDVNKSSEHEVDNLSNGKLQMNNSSDDELKVDSSSDCEPKVDSSSDGEPKVDSSSKGQLEEVDNSYCDQLKEVDISDSCQLEAVDNTDRSQSKAVDNSCGSQLEKVDNSDISHFKAVDNLNRCQVDAEDSSNDSIIEIKDNTEECQIKTEHCATGSQVDEKEMEKTRVKDEFDKIIEDLEKGSPENVFS